MNDPDAQRLEAARAQVDAAHRDVVAGRYGPALSGFRAALVELRECLGADHPEVEELVLDLETAEGMSGMAGFVQETGFRYPGDLPPGLGDAPGPPGEES